MSHDILSTRSIDRVESAFDGVNVRVIDKQRYDPQTLRDYVDGAEGLFVHSENEYDADLIRNAPNLKAIAKPGSGIDNIDVEAATEEGVVVLHTPGMNAVAVSEFTVGAILSHIRRIPEAQDHIEAGGWRSQDWWGTELRGKTVGIIGLGAAGSETAKRIRPFCERIVAYDPYISEEQAADVGAELVSFDDLLATSDVTSVHVRLTPETRGLIGADELDAMRESALLVNTSRGAVIDREALHDVLEEDRIGGAVLDVFHEEPPSPDDPVLGRDDTLTTPHLAGATVETRTMMLNVTAENLIAVLEGRTVDEEYVANPDVLE
ncbi:D-3-phosphoglycerate dehydrogenase [Halopenitus malekzadehii]|uniref:D-3-phosphoglycerate dehydrogenase n=1 Tax=Halopenitus malekzadehii TaxID=1267564 RepID=A0A1H6IMP0_9EURY|nr:hydroxyacid dehydrogenase [Halopenitus malekzadehii]SEH49959.1 D-3-phosphoglycerate dehydrogenase [Halopenitus malekzadehii]